ncbi:hypothetical protein FB451DRAFT_123403 [Mycena latifolia]|nr:hypothetical protein FB451DRAFT_123403 [Mycena latifolia]
MRPRARILFSAFVHWAVARFCLRPLRVPASISLGCCQLLLAPIASSSFFRKSHVYLSWRHQLLFAPIGGFDSRRGWI